jgi:hypothetical protein
MNKNYDFVSLIKDIVSSSSLDELRGGVVKGNEFLIKYNLSENSDEFKKLTTVVKLVRMKLKSKKKHYDESIVGKTYTISESKLISIFS